MTTEYEIEPIRGLPGELPAGEKILWRGGPDRAALARTAFHTRHVAAYFAVLTVIAIGVGLRGGGSLFGMLATAGCGVAACAILHALAWAGAATTVYTVTDRRIVLRIGVAVPKCINLPLSRIAAIDLAERGSGYGDIALRLTDMPPLGFVALWPHARPWRLAKPEPMLRAIPDAASLATAIGRAAQAIQPDGRMAQVKVSAPDPIFAEPIAA